jgi:NAD(P)H-hydrate repair Nnr-like enzyme with NAD(P)H-hydrate dehydratase domain
VVLKGSGSVIAQYRGKKQIKESAVKEEFDQRVIPPRIRVNPTGCALLATAGTGDVLAGMIGSLLAQQGDTWTSACEAVYLHGRTAQDWEAKDSFDAELLANRVSYPRISI